MLVSEGSVAWYDMTRSKLYRKKWKRSATDSSLYIIFSELCSTGNMFSFLLSWAKQGVLMIDAALTVKESQLNLRHCNIGDDKFRGEKPSHRHASLPDFLHTNKHRDWLPWFCRNYIAILEAIFKHTSCLHVKPKIFELLKSSGNYCCSNYNRSNSALERNPINNF